MCVNRCRIPLGEVGYCGTKANENGKLMHRFGVHAGMLNWYYDPIPTNCVAAWVCGAREYGCNNLAVFFRACSFNCLYCQNWHFKNHGERVNTYTVDELAACADNNTVCICYFGGDPTPQAIYSMRVAECAMSRKRVRPLRICWETNGSEHPNMMKKMATIALKSGGTIKVDLKALDAHLHQALTGSSNAWTLANIRHLATLARQRPEPPLLVVSTLLVPGYVSAEEVGRIAEFLAVLNPDVPYSLLAFYPQFFMGDLPRTSRQHAEACLTAARQNGLSRVRLANTHLLW
ncbi:MAG: radical SAM protein [candidate division KSB1 bacterium]|nr:radical SAM protein [candidate division KSB1 bacterium]MDZ7303947.1 radical SAM protein [candidate division KSB1 bacterium]MDZ7313108.1 radical SAM protein [candidate division KSB1 bacterium]